MIAAHLAAAQASPGPHPQRTFTVDQQRLHPIVGQAVGLARMPMVGKAATGRVKAIQPVAGGDPQEAGPVLGHRRHDVARNDADADRRKTRFEQRVFNIGKKRQLGVQRSGGK